MVYYKTIKKRTKEFVLFIGKYFTCPVSCFLLPDGNIVNTDVVLSHTQ